jgi:Tol biopolymer transport system component
MPTFSKILHPNPSIYQNPAWSPDGKRLAFIGVRQKGDQMQASGVWAATLDAAAADRKTPLQVYRSETT